MRKGGAYKLDDVHVVIMDAQLSARTVLRGLLYELGFREISMVQTLGETRERLAEMTPDLLIADTKAPDGDVCDLVREIRHGDCGDPFLPVLLLSWQPTQQEVKRVAGTGADILISMPVSRGGMIDAVESLIRKRKPFVVTTDYIGPDRRSRTQEEGGEVQLIEVPNPMRVKATGVPDTGNYKKCLDAINEQRVEQDGALVGLLVKTVVAHCTGAHRARDIAAALGRLRRVANEMNVRIYDTKYAHQGELCRSLISIVDRITAAEMSSGNREMPPADRDIELLRQVSLAIAAAFKADAGSTRAALTIAEEIRTAPAARAG